MKIYVRTTGERDLKQFEFLCPTYLIDKEHKPVSSFIKQLKQISEEDALLLEDDIIFCENFLEEVNHAIEKYPDQIINFFYRPMAYFIPEKIKGEKFIYNQCVFYPKGVSLKIANELETILEGKEDKVLDELHNYFKPEFINRIDEVIVFNKLTKDVLKDILNKIIKEEELRLKDLNIKINLDDKAINYFVDNGYDEFYGARPLKRLVAKTLETFLAKKIINNEIKYGDVINITYDNEIKIK